MPRYHDKQTDKGVPVTIDRDRYTEGDVIAIIDGGVTLGEKPGNVAFPVQLDASGHLRAILKDDPAYGTRYSDGDASAGSSGKLIMGDDGANVWNVSVAANGRLQVEVVAGEYDGVQYQDGDAVASPFGVVMLGYDGSNVQPVMVDGNGYLQVIERKASVLNSTADITLAANSATLIMDALAIRQSLVVQAKGTNSSVIVIGDSNVAANRGTPVHNGRSIPIESTEAVYGYNPSANEQKVCLVWTEN